MAHSQFSLLAFLLCPRWGNKAPGEDVRKGTGDVQTEK